MRGEVTDPKKTGWISVDRTKDIYDPFDLSKTSALINEFVSCISCISYTYLTILWLYNMIIQIHQKYWWINCLYWEAASLGFPLAKRIDLAVECIFSWYQLAGIHWSSYYLAISIEVHRSNKLTLFPPKHICSAESDTPMLWKQQIMGTDGRLVWSMTGSCQLTWKILVRGMNYLK